MYIVVSFLVIPFGVCYINMNNNYGTYSKILTGQDQ